MARRSREIVCTEDEIRVLRRRASAHTSTQREALRAKIILRCHEGETDKGICSALKVNHLTVSRWRKRFATHRLAGLEDLARSGKPRKYLSTDRDRVLKVLEETPPDGHSSWDGNSIAKRLGFSHDYVWRVLRKEGIQLQRMRTWCVSTDPEFAAKAADIIGLYLSPPERALVLCVDEKPSIQALSRTTGYVETSSGKIVRGLKSTYKRNGTLNLFAALTVATGQIAVQTTATKKREDFQAFLEDIIRDVPSQNEIHVILDNYATHKKNEAWLAAHPHVKFHFTPTSASWLNQVEIWFGIFSRKVLKGASFDSKDSLAQAIRDFTDAYQKNARPFVWKKREVKGSQLRNTVVNLCN